ncbi:MAG: hypothetical protein EP330_20040 [Deltaproteobacteria bacterium]|nr:MAG: hypothetical protein EP330_20040 [Deltaproteobacteria bacterium]
MRTRMLIAMSLLASACAEMPQAELPRFDASPSESAAVWRGFRHDWGYNHRVNRLGNWVGPVACDADTCEVEVAHAAASGLGTDSGAWRASATVIDAPGSGFLPGATALTFHEARAEGRLVERIEQVTVPLTGVLAGQEQYQVLLQGYDLMALEDADMFRSMDLALGEPVVDAEGGTLSFEVRLALELDCDRLECDGTWHLSGKLETDVDYAAHVMWLVVGTDADAVQCAAQSGGYTWSDASLADELQAKDATAHGVIPDVGEQAVLGLQALSMRLSSDSHVVSWVTEVQPTASSVHGAGYALTLMFKQWSAATWERNNSYTTEGEAWTEATVCALDLPYARTAEVDVEGEVFWKANGGVALSDDAVVREVRSVALPVLPTPVPSLLSAGSSAGGRR